MPDSDFFSNNSFYCHFTSAMRYLRGAPTQTSDTHTGPGGWCAMMHRNIHSMHKDARHKNNKNRIWYNKNSHYRVAKYSTNLRHFRWNSITFLPDSNAMHFSTSYCLLTCIQNAYVDSASPFSFLLTIYCLAKMITRFASIPNALLPKITNSALRRTWLPKFLFNTWMTSFQNLNVVAQPYKKWYILSTCKQ